MLPKVSVAIITYNQKAYLREAIESVLLQDYPNFEIVVADDASTDGTQEMLYEYDQRHPDLFQIILSERNGGITANCNRAFFACTGAYIVLMGGDDLMLPSRITKQVAILEDYPDLAICASAADVFDSATNTTISISSAKFRGKRRYGCGSYIESCNCITASASMVRRSMCPKAGFDIRLPMVSDYLFFAETSRNGDILAQDEVLTRYRVHAAQVTATSTMVYPDPWISLQILEFKYPDLIAYTHAVRAEFNLSQGLMLLKGEKHEASRIYLRTSLFYRKRLKTLLFLLFSYLPSGIQGWANTTKTRLRTRNVRVE